MLPVLDAIRLRLLPALLTAAGVVLVSAGLLTYADPTQAGLQPKASPTAGTLAPSEAAATPVAGPSGPVASLGASASVPPGPTATTPPTAPVSIVPDPTPATGRAVATRVVVPVLGIDLPVVKGNDGYPFCNVAMYLHTARSAARDAFGQPGEGRATYLYAHARDGMFGPIYEYAIVRGRPEKLQGLLVQVYTSDLRLHLYEIREYRLHVTDLDGPLGATQEQLWLQTSEGPKGTAGKTQLIAYPISVTDADPAEATPRAKPVRCG